MYCDHDIGITEFSNVAWGYFVNNLTRASIWAGVSLLLKAGIAPRPLVMIPLMDGFERPIASWLAAVAVPWQGEQFFVNMEEASISDAETDLLQPDMARLKNSINIRTAFIFPRGRQIVCRLIQCNR